MDPCALLKLTMRQVTKKNNIRKRNDKINGNRRYTSLNVHCTDEKKRRKSNLTFNFEKKNFFQWNLASQHLGTNADQMVVNTKSLYSLYKNTIRTRRTPRLASLSFLTPHSTTRAFWFLCECSTRNAALLRCRMLSKCPSSFYQNSKRSRAQNPTPLARIVTRGC